MSIENTTDNINVENTSPNDIEPIADGQNQEETLGEETTKKNKRAAIKSLFRIQRYMNTARPRHGEGHGRSGELDPYRGQGRVLSLLSLKPEMTQREIAHILDMRRQSLGELLAKLERDGMIEREQSQQDRRMMVVRLTEQGAAEAKKALPKRGKLHAALDTLSEEEQGQLADYLNRVADAYLEEMPAEMRDRIKQREEERSKMAFKDMPHFVREMRDSLPEDFEGGHGPGRGHGCRGGHGPEREYGHGHGPERGHDCDHDHGHGRGHGRGGCCGGKGEHGPGRGHGGHGRGDRGDFGDEHRGEFFD